MASNIINMGLGCMYGRRRSLLRLCGVDQHNQQIPGRRPEPSSLDKIKNFLVHEATAIDPAIVNKNICINNLRTIQIIKESWQADTGGGDLSVPTEAELFGPGLYMDAEPVCPSAGTYTLNAVGTNPTCTIAGHVVP